MNVTTHILSHPGISESNEDVILLEEKRHIYGVFDGASSLDGYHNEAGLTGGYIASRTAQDYFLQNSCNNLREYFSKANEAIEHKHLVDDIDTTDALHRFGTTAAVVWLHEDGIELLQCGDSTIVFIDTNGTASVPLGIENHDIPAMVEWKKAAEAGKKGRSEIRPVIAHLVDITRRNANITHGVMNGDPRAIDFIQHKTISQKGVAHILIMTDGMYIPKEDPTAPTDWQEYAELYLDGGVEKLFAHTRSLELSDPDQTRYPRYKMHDDASIIAIDLQ